MAKDQPQIQKQQVRASSPNYRRMAKIGGDSPTFEKAPYTEENSFVSKERKDSDRIDTEEGNEDVGPNDIKVHLTKPHVPVGEKEESQ